MWILTAVKIRNIAIQIKFIDKCVCRVLFLCQFWAHFEKMHKQLTRIFCIVLLRIWKIPSKKVKVKVKWSLYRPGVAQRVGRDIALLFHDRGTRRGWVVSSTPRPHFNPGKEPVPFLQEAGWAPGPDWKGGKSRPQRDSIPNRPARSSVAIPTELPGLQEKMYFIKILTAYPNKINTYKHSMTPPKNVFYQNTNCISK